MTFNPSVYQRPDDFDMQIDPTLPDEAWLERFYAHMIKVGGPVADDKFRSELAAYAKFIAMTYLKDRKEYVDPEEAADTDISYWEDDE